MVNQLFTNWYTDTMDIYRVVSTNEGNLTRQERQKVYSGISCRVYSTQKSGPNMTDNAARVRSSEKLSCDLSVDIRAGDELLITRGGNIGHAGEPERYFAGKPQSYYDPVGGALTGLQHKEVGLMMDNIIG